MNFLLIQIYLHLFVASQINNNKKIKTKHLTPISFARVNVKLRKPSIRTLKFLFDSGALKTIICKSFVKSLRLKQDNKTTWQRVGGNISTMETTQLQFCLPELHDSRIIKWKVHVHKGQGLRYDMIIGRDLMTKLGMIIDFNDQTLEWDKSYIKMRNIDISIEELYFHSYESEPNSFKDST